MALSDQRAKSAAQAAYMKERGIQRRSGSCPWGCGYQYGTSPSGSGSGSSLLNHLTRCQGAGAKRKR